jgi:DNA-directed RNA polymerase subunit RPC12/RpoP
MDDYKELFLFLIAAAFVAISNWFKGRKQTEETDTWDEVWGEEQRPSSPPPRSTPVPPPLPPQRPAPASDWEKELRDLLEGREPVRQQPPPPPVIVPPRKSVPPPPPPLVTQPRVIADEEGPGELSLAKLKESAAAYRRASQLHGDVADRLRQASAEHTHHYKAPCQRCGGRIEFPVTSAGRTIHCPHCGRETKLVIATLPAHLTGARPARKKRSGEAAGAVRLLRSPQGIRQAVLASVILGAPKAVEGWQGGARASGTAWSE